MNHSLPNPKRSGKYALIRYRGGAEKEEAVDDHSIGEPVRIRMGVGDVPRGIDEALYSMEVGEKRLVTIPPEKAYGQHDPAGVRVFPRSAFPNGENLEEGFVGRWRSPISQQEIPAIVTKATKDFVQVDFNHPFAGKTLEYGLELVDIEDETPQRKPL